MIRKILNKIGLDFYSNTRSAEIQSRKYIMLSDSLTRENSLQAEHIEELYNRFDDLLKNHNPKGTDISFYNAQSVIYDIHGTTKLKIRLDPINYEIVIDGYDNETKNFIPIISEYYCEKIKSDFENYIATNIKPAIMTKLGDYSE